MSVNKNFEFRSVLTKREKIQRNIVLKRYFHMSIHNTIADMIAYSLLHLFSNFYPQKKVDRQNSL